MSSMMLYISQYEQQGVGIQWNNVFVAPIKEDMFNFGLTCAFLLFDSVLYGIIGFTILLLKDHKWKEQVALLFRKQGETLFSRIANCWLISVDIGTEESSSIPSESSPQLKNSKSANHHQIVSADVGIRLENLTKIYTISRNEERVAVCDLSLSFNVGEVGNVSLHETQETSKFKKFHTIVIFLYSKI